MESTDGRFLFYTKYGYGTVGLFRQPLPSGEEEMIYPFFQTISVGDWALTDRGLYVIERYDRPDTKTVLAAKNPAIRYFDFASRTTTDITPLSNPGGDPGLSVVDGGRALVFSVSRSKHDLMIIRNHR